MKLMTKTEVTRAIAGIKGRSGKLSVSIHEAAVSCLQHMEEHGNMDLATNLHSAVSPAYRAHLKRWFNTFGPIGWNKKEGKFRKVKNQNANPFDVPGAIETSPDALATLVDDNRSEFEEIRALKSIRASLAKKVKTNIATSAEAFDDAMELSITGIDAAVLKLLR